MFFWVTSVVTPQWECTYVQRINLHLCSMLIKFVIF